MGAASPEGVILMILGLSVRLVATIHGYLYAYAPSNVLIRYLRSPGGCAWALPISVALAAGYLAATAGITAIIDSGGPGWLNMLGLVCVWNSIKFGWLALAGVAHSAGRLALRLLHPDRAGVLGRQ